METVRVGPTEEFRRQPPLAGIFGKLLPADIGELPMTAQAGPTGWYMLPRTSAHTSTVPNEPAINGLMFRLTESQAKQYGWTRLTKPDSWTSMGGEPTMTIMVPFDKRVLVPVGLPQLREPAQQPPRGGYLYASGMRAIDPPPGAAVTTPPPPDVATQLQAKEREIERLRAENSAARDLIERQGALLERMSAKLGGMSA